MRIGIAGYGNIGQYVAEVFSSFCEEIVVFDPPKGMGRVDNLDAVDFLFVCVPTPSLPDGACDTSIVEDVVSQAHPRKAIVCHSTVAIGTIDHLINTYDKPIVYVPQYVGESSDHYYRDRKNLDFFIFGGYEPSISEVSALFRIVFGDGPQHVKTAPTTAEIVKYMENAFLAMKVSFCNEFFDVAKTFGVDYEDVRKLWLLDHRVNPSHTEVTEEGGYGGKCLPKDVNALCATAWEFDIPMEIMQAVRLGNERRRANSDSGLQSKPISTISAIPS
jgi:UDPglucose 6-dehydrogenase